MMNLKVECPAFARTAFAAVFAAFAASCARAEEAAAEPEAPSVDPALQAEVAYVEALIGNGLPDFAEPVIKATKEKWPESESIFFAIEIRGMLLLGKTEEAEAKIAALPDRKGAKYWAARLEVANNHFNRGRKDECAKIYAEFFKANEKPGKELASFMRQARYQWSQLLLMQKRYKEAADNDVLLLKTLAPDRDDGDANLWCQVACEAAEIYLRLASEQEPKNRERFLAPAKALVDKLLWMQSRPVYFGRAISMKAHMELLRGSVARAQATIDDYMPQLAELHAQIVENDPDGSKGLLRLSPMPLCRYMLANIMWSEAQAEAKKAKRDDERIKSLMFGERGKNGKRNGGGAYNHALNVFVKYPQSTWASQAGDLADAIAAFAEREYGAKIKTNISKADRERVRAMQFKGAADKFGEGDWQGAVDDYFAALSSWPEGKESVQAVEAIANAYINMLLRTKDKEKAESLRLDADAVEGYLSERFGGARDRVVMSEAGDATLRLAAKEKSLGNVARGEALLGAFLSNYRTHANAPATAATMAYEAQKAGRLRDAVKYYGVIGKYYTNSTYYASSLSGASQCYDRLGDRAAAIEAMAKYADVEKSPIKSLQARMNVAVMYQKAGQELLDGAETNATPEAVSAQLAQGSAQTIRGIKQFADFAKRAGDMLADPSVSAEDKATCAKLREGAMFLAGDCWGRLTKPEEKLDAFRRRSVEALEEYVRQYPKGQYAKAAYVKLGMLYTVLGEMEKCRDALARLRKEFPDSEEARKAMPRLARNLVEYSRTIGDEAKRESLKKEATQIYADMIKGENANYQAFDFVRAGESLVEARGWDLADEAFDKAIAKAGTNQLSVVARARLGKAKSLFAQKNYSEARESLDAFMADPRMSKMAMATNACDLIVQVAMQQGREERDDALRMKHYGAALGAIKKLRGYWSKEPVWKQDRAFFLMPADVKIAQVEAELSMGLDEAAKKTRAVAAANLQSYLQSRAPGPDRPIDGFSAEDLENLEGAYARLVQLLVKMGSAQAGRALAYGREYLEYFPDGENRASVQRAVNEARAMGAKETDSAPDAAPVAAPAAEAAAGDGE